nr:50S ribosomal protein L10 [Nanoarchaeum sp.]
MKATHISQKKKKEVEVLKKLLQSDENVGIIDLTNLPSAQFQRIKHKLRKDMQVRVTKKSLLKLAIEQVKEKRKGIENLEKYLVSSMPALMLTKEEPFKIAKLISKNKSQTAAKPGQVSPKDLIIPEGPTSFSPGPIIGELGAAGIKAAIEGGKVVIKKETTIVHKGDIITQKQSDMLAKFGIKPMEIGINLVAVYEQGEVYDKEILFTDEEAYIEMIKTIATEALNLAVFAEYPTEETMQILIQRAEREKLAVKHELKDVETEFGAGVELNQTEVARKNILEYSDNMADKAHDLIEKARDEMLGE